MVDRKEESFRLKPTAPKRHREPGSQSFRSLVHAEMNKLGGVVQPQRPRRGAKLGRGHAAARLMGSEPGPRSRRVVIKTRVVRLETASPRSVSTHLRYIVRDGVSRDGQPAQAYGKDVDSADLKDFEERSLGDRHQFRFIIAPEDAVELDELRPYIRHVMAAMETDLGTRLEWVAVDHWDTDNPHTHVVLRGKDQTGQNLVIGREYISYGMRKRASEIADQWLGERTELEIQQSQRRDVEQERWTGLDRELQARSKDGRVDLREVPGNASDLRRRALLIARLQRLEALGLATKLEAGGWELRANAEPVLRSMGERGDIIRTMQRAFGKEPRQLAILSASSPGPVIGRIAAKGMADELDDKPYLVIDGLDGRGHYVTLPVGTDLSRMPIGGIVEATPVKERAADRNIAALAREGLYSTQQHLSVLRTMPGSDTPPEEIVAGHVRRLEALRRAGIVERVTEGLWKVPPDLVQRGTAYERERLSGVSVQVHSEVPIDKQIGALGATWLGRRLVSSEAMHPGAGAFAADVAKAIAARIGVLEKHRLLQPGAQNHTTLRKLLSVLRDRELEHFGKVIAAETGRTYRPVTDGQSVSGVYRRSEWLVSGRFAMLDDGLGFSLVPWKPVIEKQLGQTISAVTRGEDVSWYIGRQRDRGLSL